MKETNPDFNQDNSRRRFFKLLGGGLIAASSWPLAARQAFGQKTGLQEKEQVPPLPRAAGSIEPDDAKFWSFVREQFPITKNNSLIYMNNGTMGPSPYYINGCFLPRNRKLILPVLMAGTIWPGPGWLNLLTAMKRKLF